MGHIIMPAFAFRSALSEDSSVRSGFALSEADMLAHLPVDHHLRECLVSNEVLRLGSEDYAEAVGDLLFALGAMPEPGMPTLGMRLMALLGGDWRSLFALEELRSRTIICVYATRTTMSKLRSSPNSKPWSMARRVCSTRWSKR